MNDSAKALHVTISVLRSFDEVYEYDTLGSDINTPLFMILMVVGRSLGLSCCELYIVN